MILIVPMEWKFLGFNGDSSIAIFAKQPVIQHRNESPKLWVREEFSTVMPSGYRSSVALWEFDCRGHRKQRDKSTFFAENNLSGSQVYQQTDPRGWDDWTPGTFEDEYWYLVCPK
jgi:hypothetical protein